MKLLINSLKTRPVFNLDTSLLLPVGFTLLSVDVTWILSCVLCSFCFTKSDLRGFKDPAVTAQGDTELLVQIIPRGESKSIHESRSKREEIHLSVCDAGLCFKLKSPKIEARVRCETSVANQRPGFALSFVLPEVKHKIEHNLLFLFSRKDCLSVKKTLMDS